MSGSIGGSRIPTKSVRPTVDNYINKVLKGFTGYQECDTTGSYNVIMKLNQEKPGGHGDIDLVVHINSDDLKKTKKEFKKYLDSLPDEVTPRFTFGNHKGEKSQLYGAIVTCGFPIDGDESKYVQIDNIIVTTKNDMNYQKTFLDLPAQKQALIQGLVRVVLSHEDNENIFKHFKIEGLPEPAKDQEYEFVCSPTGLSLRLITLTPERKEDTKKRIEVWRSNNWDDVEWLLKNYDVTGSAEECLDKVDKKITDKRSRERIVGIIKSMIRVGVGEVGTPKGDAKQAFIDLASQKLLNESKYKSLNKYINENMKSLYEYINEQWLPKEEWLKQQKNKKPKYMSFMDYDDVTDEMVENFWNKDEYKEHLIPEDKIDNKYKKAYNIAKKNVAMLDYVMKPSFTVYFDENADLYIEVNTGASWSIQNHLNYYARKCGRFKLYTAAGSASFLKHQILYDGEHD